MWERAGYLEALPGHRHLLFDHRGHGQSDQPRDLEAHRLNEYVEDVVAVLDELGIDRAPFVGYSGGARIGYALAARHPARVEALVGIGGVAHPSDSHAWRSEMAHQVRHTGFRAWLEDMSASESDPGPPWLMDNLAATPTEMFALQVEAWADEPTECACFPMISAPTLIICGERENPDGAAELAIRALPNGTCRVLPGLGHLQAFWRTDLTAPLIAEFLAGLTTQASAGQPAV
jgi:pimeloyl-ACP methyl ester carboxylesterase